MCSMTMAKNHIDDQLISWDRIFKELLMNAQELTRDLLTGVSYVGASGVVMLALGVAVLFFLLRYATITDPVYWGLVSLTAGSTCIVGALTLVKFLQLRRKYTRLYRAQQELTGA
jgi:membrane-bound ClpP family serine protease